MLGPHLMHNSSVTPILRIFDEARAKEFYVGFLGFVVDWEHRFEPNAPLYMQVSRENAILHLSEHHGDGTPGSALRIQVQDVRSQNRALLEKRYKYARPGVHDTEWNTREMTIADPFGNRLTFFEPLSSQVGPSVEGKHIELRDAMSRIPGPGGERFAELFIHGTLTVEMYEPRGTDTQKPHTRDEAYVVACGHGEFVCGNERVTFGPGDFLFAPAHAIHRFEDFTDDLAVWVIFYGPEGGER